MSVVGNARLELCFFVREFVVDSAFDLTCLLQKLERKGWISAVHSPSRGVDVTHGGVSPVDRFLEAGTDFSISFDFLIAGDTGTHPAQLIPKIDLGGSVGVGVFAVELLLR
jgi:hypothetical protein